MNNTFDQAKYVREYNKQKYCVIKLNIPKSKREVIDDLVETQHKSINRLFIDAVEKQYGVDLTLDLGTNE